MTYVNVIPLSKDDSNSDNNNNKILTLETNSKSTIDALATIALLLQISCFFGDANVNGVGGRADVGVGVGVVVHLRDPGFSRAWVWST